jgi:hypothetical protein
MSWFGAALFGAGFLAALMTGGASELSPTRSKLG